MDCQNYLLKIINQISGVLDYIYQCILNRYVIDRKNKVTFIKLAVNGKHAGDLGYGKGFEPRQAGILPPPYAGFIGAYLT
jgi:hypothetical protein